MLTSNITLNDSTKAYVYREISRTGKLTTRRLPDEVEGPLTGSTNLLVVQHDVLKSNTVHTGISFTSQAPIQAPTATGCKQIGVDTISASLRLTYNPTAGRVHAAVLEQQRKVLIAFLNDDAQWAGLLNLES